MSQVVKRRTPRQIHAVIGGYLIILLLLGITTKVALDNFQTLHDDLRQVVHDNNAKSSQLAAMRNAILQRMLLLYTAAQQLDPFELDETIQQYGAMARQFITARKQLDKMALTEHQRAQLQQQRTIIAEAQTILDEVISLIQNGEQAWIGNRMLTAQQMNKRAVNQLQAMIDLQSQIAAKAVIHSAKAMASARSRIFLFIATTVLVTSLILGMVIATIRRQNQSVISLLEQLEESNEKLEERVANRSRELLQSQSENLRMSAELNVASQIQQMLLPKKSELSEVQELEIAASMAPAEEAGGDYFDLLQQDDWVIFGIGDVTGHGLESSLVMLMTQTGVRTLVSSGNTDPQQVIITLNRAIYDNLQRMDSYKNLTLMLGCYRHGELTLSGQHEEVLLVRAGSGKVEQIDTIDVGFPLGLEPNIDAFTQNYHLMLQSGDTLLLYTDGIPEAQDNQENFYGLGRLAEQLLRHIDRPVQEIHDHILADLYHFIGNHTIYDDISLLVIRKR